MALLNFRVICHRGFILRLQFLQDEYLPLFFFGLDGEAALLTGAGGAHGLDVCGLPNAHGD